MGGTGDEVSVAKESVCIPKRRKRDWRFFLSISLFSTPCQRRKLLDFKVEREGGISCFVDLHTLHTLDSKKSVIRSSSVRVIIIHEC